MTDNLALWHAVERTPKEHTKAITGKAYKGTSPKPHYLVMKATETFGPCGIGWGYTLVRERIEDGAEGEKVHIAHIRVWYKWDGERGEVEHVGQTMFSGFRKSGEPYTDEDAPKKSVTDALVKALSMIGFAGDIFMGRYDDSKYVAELDDERDAQPARQDNTVAGPFSKKESSTVANAMILALEKAETLADIDALREQNKSDFQRLLRDDKLLVSKARQIREEEITSPQAAE
jgi:hypothetical protein